VRLDIVFVGMNNDLAAACLTALLPMHRVLAVFESTRGRGTPSRLRPVLRPGRLRRLARRHRIPFGVLPRGQLGPLERQLREQPPDALCVATMSHLLPGSILALPRLGTVNLHPSLLPAYRGPGALFWQLLDGVPEAGVTAHLLDAGEDTGPILAQARFPLPLGTSYHELTERIVETSPALLLEALERLAQGSPAEPQPRESPTRRARWWRAEDRARLDPTRRGLAEAARLLRGVGPFLDLPPVSWRRLGWRPYVRSGEPGDPGAAPGTIAWDARGWYLAHPEGRLRLDYRWEPWAWLDRALRSR
jgi:methionyl-tRNA formyltransferase